MHAGSREHYGHSSGEYGRCAQSVLSARDRNPHVGKWHEADIGVSRTIYQPGKVPLSLASEPFGAVALDLQGAQQRIEGIRERECPFVALSGHRCRR
jgi:hypothetical protein